MRRSLVCLVLGVVGCGGGESGGSGGRVIRPVTTEHLRVPHTDPPPDSVAWSADMQPIADANNRFALDLYARLREEKGNVFFSPYSIHTALAMTATGARGATRDEMAKVLHLPTEPEKALAAGDLGRFYGGGRKEYELAVGNALWGQAGWPWRADFKGVLADRFGAGFREVDFRADPQGQRKQINAWVSEKTRGRIPEVLAPDNVSEATRIVLVNAIFFKGDWAHAFKRHETKDAPFRLAAGGSVPVPLMHTTLDCPYAEIPGGQLVRLPYKGGELEMVVLLPKEPTGLPALEASLSAEALKKWLDGSAERKVSLYLPRFTTKQRFDLERVLGKMGMSLAFGGGDFGGMVEPRSDVEGVRIAKVVHEAFVAVNEEGTEAAAATAVVGNAPSPPPPRPVEFRADRPFVYLIRDARHGTVLFLGRVEKP
jgi:serpin B